MKTTMSKRNIAKFHKLLQREVPVGDIVKILKVTKETLRKFTPAKVAEWKKVQAELAAAEAVEEAAKKETAAALGAAASEVLKKDK